MLVHGLADKTKAARAVYGKSLKNGLCGRVRAGVPVGLLAYEGEISVGWISIAPRETFRNMGGPAAGPDELIYAINCFFIPRALRGAGLGQKLLRGAIDHARDMGASVLEATPVVPDSASYRFMGFVPSFEREGFKHICDAGTRRKVMRLSL